ncbi:MAG: hypothetical protein CUN49_04615 [Candidatus Thermofonsia Clade 1 bacterium]|uniref:Uncharacterized protein n=1 Tax=Candidatus Thermofonsia Clade 1 bacterium TaxID=2364210 RepID=A0A2M8PGA2_9CHLR|nr:MAG: hypothetical protein CUN49_04615 [Candidatus Thermofonsia Clade 1 bacterium]
MSLLNMTDKPTLPAETTPASRRNWKTSAYVIGSLLGALLGFLSAHFYTRSAEENNNGQPPKPISTADLFRLSLAAIALLRQISDLGVNRNTRR